MSNIDNALKALNPVKHITFICDKFFNELGFGAEKNVFNFQLFLCMLNVALSLWPMICYLVYSTDVHTIFWLGPVPQYVNLMVPCCLCALNLGVTIFTNCNSSLKGHHARAVCFILFLVIGSILLGSGLYVVMIAEEQAINLTEKCGKSALTMKLELTWRKLNIFYQKCDPTRTKSITTCPGYTRAFPNRVFVNYLEELEYEFSCVGFCSFLAKPIFNADAQLGNRCSSALGEHVESISSMVGMPTAVYGLVCIIIGVCLSAYEHL